MITIFKGAEVAAKEGVVRRDLAVSDGRIVAVAPEIIPSPDDEVIPCDNFFITPGLIDVHVHFREPGQEYKETIKTGSAAAFYAGYQLVCPMPNLDPAPYTLENLERELLPIARGAATGVIPYGRITKDGREPADLEELAPYVCAFSDDGKGVQGEADMRTAMERVRDLDMLVVAHCEDETYDTYDPRSETSEVVRDLRLSEETGCAFHICHLSAKGSVAALREAKENGVDASGETCPHYLLFHEPEIPHTGNYKMNPPIRKEEDQEALWEGIHDGTIEILVTDHAPHSEEEKSKDFDSLFGIVGLETAFPVMYTRCVKEGRLTLTQLHDLMCKNPAERFRLGTPYLAEGEEASFFLFDLETTYTIDPGTFYSKGRSTPFAGWEVSGKAVYHYGKEGLTTL